MSYTVSNCERTNSEGHCDFTVRYGTGAYGISGSLVNDVLRVGSLEATVSLGAISSMFDGWQQRPANGLSALPFFVALASLYSSAPLVVS